MASAFRYLEALQAAPGLAATLTQSAIKANDPQQPLAVKAARFTGAQVHQPEAS